ncbi:hypothetical protein IFM51744_02580 [Aspergillus udagawae]|nr:hypothetical protein IFM51744_02580 [Aspergillus udagawae]GFG18009.1 hypothetical protein IFM5058_08783 [Aspergillus udagawae]
MPQQTLDRLVPRGLVSAELVFYEPPADGSAPFNYVEEPSTGQKPRNYGSLIKTVPISDIRGEEDRMSLDREGFEILHNVPSSATYETFSSEDEIKKCYYPEVERLLLDSIPGAHSVVLFDHTIRRAIPQAARQPVNQVHADQTKRSAEMRVRRHIPDPADAERLLQGRYRIINAWRPTNGTVESSPLAFASAVTSCDSDFVTIEHRYPNFNGEIMGVKYNPNMQWKYVSGLRGDETLLIKCADTQAGVAQQIARSAFVDPRSRIDAKLRESIEVRALVFG